LIETTSPRLWRRQSNESEPVCRKAGPVRQIGGSGFGWSCFPDKKVVEPPEASGSATRRGAVDVPLTTAALPAVLTYPFPCKKMEGVKELHADLAPTAPGAIHEGGERGYSLSHPLGGVQQSRSDSCLGRRRKTRQTFDPPMETSARRLPRHSKGGS
jgi:hypothetical protein